MYWSYPHTRTTCFTEHTHTHTHCTHKLNSATICRNKNRVTYTREFHNGGNWNGEIDSIDKFYEGIHYTAVWMSGSRKASEPWNGISPRNISETGWTMFKCRSNIHCYMKGVLMLLKHFPSYFSTPHIVTVDILF